MLSLNKRFNKTDRIWLYSDPRIAEHKAKQYLGKGVILFRSETKTKKYLVRDPLTNKLINFGQMGYQDFTKHKDEARRINYLDRTEKIRGNWKANKYSPNNLSRNILW